MMRYILMIIAVLGVGCTSEAVGPAEPVWGKQPCDHCMMLLSEPPPAAQALFADGTRRYFDDVGCLAAYLSGARVPPKAAWVRGPDGTGWVDALSARYSTGHRTPMDYGFRTDVSGLTFREMQARVMAKSIERRAEGPQ